NEKSPVACFDAMGWVNKVVMLEYKALSSGRYVRKVDRYFPSSKRCYACGYVNLDLALSDREWMCRQCGIRHQRDLTAAINLELEGIRLLAGSGFIGVTTVELAASTLKLASGQVAGCEAVRIHCGHLST